MLAAFWLAAGGWPAGDDGEGCPALRAPTGRGPWLEFWAVSDPPSRKARAHLDIAPPADGDQRAEMGRLVGLGARPADVGQGADVSRVVLTDPEGNEFGVLTPR